MTGYKILRTYQYLTLTTTKWAPYRFLALRLDGTVVRLKLVYVASKAIHGLLLSGIVLPRHHLFQLLVCKQPHLRFAVQPRIPETRKPTGHELFVHRTEILVGSAPKVPDRQSKT
jgi:hypothetical protein